MNNRSTKKLLKAMVEEDVGVGDLTSSFTPNKRVRAVIKANERGFVSGIDELRTLFRTYGITAKPKTSDGRPVKNGEVVFLLEGKARNILIVERTALNIISRMSGIATLTRKYVEILKRMGSKTRITATRKTTPLFRYFEKKAVVAGGGLTHRMGLYDMVMIKDNHLKLFENDVEWALKSAKKASVRSKIEVEVSNRRDAIKAALNRANVIMLDNMKPAAIRGVISELEEKGLRKNLLLEVSGRISLKNIRSYGALGADWISIGKLTHSAAALDFGLEITD